MPPHARVRALEICFGGDDPAWAEEVLGFLADTMQRR